MRPGKLRHLVTINRYSTAPNSISNEGTAVYTPGDTVWASIEPLSMRELVSSQEVQGVSTHRIRMRYNGNVARLDQIQYNGRTFEVEGVLNTEERNIELVLICHEIT